MIEFTREEFKRQFGKSPGELFDLTKILTEQHKIEAMRLPDPTLMRIRREYLTLRAPNKPDLISAIDVGYFIDKDGFKAVIEHIVIFDDQTEQDLDKAKSAATEENWNDN